jgi:flagellar motor switch protein FliN/FliY
VTLIDDLRSRTDAAAAATAALAAALGEDAPTVAEAGSAIGDIEAANVAQFMELDFHAGDDDGLVAIAMSQALADALERSAADETLPTAVAPVLEAVVRAVGEIADAETENESVGSTDLATLLERAGEEAHDAVAYAIKGADDVIAGYVVVAVGAATATDEPEMPGATPRPMGDVATPKVLADVEMGVTAELGRCHMTVRELLSLTPGAVIDLDRAAGAPVDVLVNGTLIARGEVVVIDEEFGIRISEILSNGASAA